MQPPECVWKQVLPPPRMAILIQNMISSLMDLRLPQLHVVLVSGIIPGPQMMGTPFPQSSHIGGA